MPKNSTKLLKLTTTPYTIIELTYVILDIQFIWRLAAESQEIPRIKSEDKFSTTRSGTKVEKSQKTLQKAAKIADIAQYL